MGRNNTTEERAKTLEWANEFRPNKLGDCSPLSLAKLRNIFYNELRNYFALCCISRHKNESVEMVNSAHKIVFRVRTDLEKSIYWCIKNSIRYDLSDSEFLFEGNFFGASKKQGTSLRMSLMTCNPTKECANACYAHDTLDAAPASVIRGVLNSFVAEFFVNGGINVQNKIMKSLLPHTRRGIRSAISETNRLKEGFNRAANIRFAHVGEIAKYPSFANVLAKQVLSESKGKVLCVVYTRHHKAAELDPGLWIINFTLDKSSLNRRSWAPDEARIVYSAFGGDISDEVDVNFLEHHRWSHFYPTGKAGRICPATLPQTKIRSCDAAQCDLCFKKPKI